MERHLWPSPEQDEDGVDAQDAVDQVTAGPTTPAPRAQEDV